jgi:hypothetical protein
VPTLTFDVLYCFFVIAHDRRRILCCSATKHPTSAWVIQQLREAFPYECVRRSVRSRGGRRWARTGAGVCERFGAKFDVAAQGRIVDMEELFQRGPVAGLGEKDEEDLVGDRGLLRVGWVLHA